jgi:hypothetical protein
MAYVIKRCKQCNKIINAHKRGSHYELKGSCEHIPMEIRASFKEHDMKTYLKNETY